MARKKFKGVYPMEYVAQEVAKGTEVRAFQNSYFIGEMRLFGWTLKQTAQKYYFIEQKSIKVGGKRSRLWIRVFKLEEKDVNLPHDEEKETRLLWSRNQIYVARRVNGDSGPVRKGYGG